MWSIFNQTPILLGGSTSIMARIIYILSKYKLDRKSSLTNT